MSIENLGPSDGVRRGLERALDARESSRSPRGDGANEASGGGDVQRTAESAGVASERSTARGPSSTQGDRVELSIAAQALSTPEDATTAALRARQTAYLRDAVANGTLGSMERIARAAHRLLGG
jgi:hypothetical protein